MLLLLKKRKHTKRKLIQYVWRLSYYLFIYDLLNSLSCSFTYYYFSVMTKLAIVWSHGTWKSTLLKELSLSFSGRIIPEVARDIMWEYWKIPQEMTQNERYNFQRDIYSRQFATEQLYGNFISDRGVYDNLAYAFHTDKHLFNILRDHAKKNHKWYDRTVYIPIEFWLENDGIRFTSDAFQIQIDETIKEIMKDFSVDRLECRWSVLERKKLILPLIK